MCRIYGLSIFKLFNFHFRMSEWQYQSPQKKRANSSDVRTVPQTYLAYAYLAVSHRFLLSGLSIWWSFTCPTPESRPTRSLWRTSGAAWPSGPRSGRSACWASSWTLPRTAPGTKKNRALLGTTEKHRNSHLFVSFPKFGWFRALVFNFLPCLIPKLFRASLSARSLSCSGSAARRLVSCLMITLGAGMLEGSLLVNWAHSAAPGRVSCRDWKIHLMWYHGTLERSLVQENVVIDAYATYNIVYYLNLLKTVTIEFHVSSHWTMAGFVLRYSLEQLLPSLIWCTQDASLVAEAMGFEPQVLLKNLEGSWSKLKTYHAEVLKTSQQFWPLFVTCLSIFCGSEFWDMFCQVLRWALWDQAILPSFFLYKWPFETRRPLQVGLEHQRCWRWANATLSVAYLQASISWANCFDFRRSPTTCCNSAVEVVFFFFYVDICCSKHMFKLSQVWMMEVRILTRVEMIQFWGSNMSRKCVWVEMSPCPLAPKNASFVCAGNSPMPPMRQLFGSNLWGQSTHCVANRLSQICKGWSSFCCFFWQTQIHKSELNDPNRMLAA